MINVYTAIFLTCNSMNTTYTTFNQDNTKSKSIIKFIDLDKLPSLNVDLRSKSQRSILTQRYRLAAKDLISVDFADLEQDVVNLVKKEKNNGSWGIDNMFRIIVLFRFLYLIPDDAVYESKNFGGLSGETRTIKNGVRVGFPTLNRKAGASIEYSIGGYAGELYDVVGELRYLNTHFKRRKY